MTAQSRHAKGSVGGKGGQFAEELRGDPGALALDEDMLLGTPLDDTPIDKGKGRWEVVSATTQEQPREFTNGMRVQQIRITPAGVPAIRERALAAAAVYSDLESPADLWYRFESLAKQNKPASVLSVSKSGDVQVIEGRCTIIDGEPYLMVKGSSTRGYKLKALGAIDIYPGYGGQRGLSTTFHRRMAQFVPDVEPVHAIHGFDELPDDDDVYGTENPPIVSAYLMAGPDLGTGKSPGCVFFATSIQRGDGPNGGHILNGYFWAPNSSNGLTSESGSFYSTDLAMAGGKITGYDSGSMTMRDCYKDMPEDLTEGLRRVTGRSAAR